MSTIREILLILALLLVMAGGAGYSWALSEQKKETLLRCQQQQKFSTKVAELDKLLDGKISVRALSPQSGEEKLQEELTKHQEKEATTRSDILTLSIMSLAVGLTIFAGWLVSLIIYSVSAGFRNLRKLLKYIFSSLRKAWNKLKALLKETGKILWRRKLFGLGKSGKILLTALKPLRKFFTNVCAYLGKVWNNLLIAACLEKIKKALQGRSLYRLHKSRENLLAVNKLRPDYSDNESGKIDMLYCDEKSLINQRQTVLAAASKDLNTRLLDQLEQNIRKTILSGYHQNALEVQCSLKAQNETIEKQVAEVIQMAKAITEASSRNNEPVKNTLDELAKQVSAIREHTSFQQDKIEKLQEGYDWNIIKNFCLRVIRCIDNLENRIEKLSEQNVDTTDLEEIMDELLFALESSGVEQFNPEINSEYNGKEKFAEVVKDRACPDDPDMRGKIAEVVKPGYQYVIDDANVKVVRAARVKLFS